MDVKALQARLRDFAAARDWQSYHSPKNLAMALMVEAAELLELFQWKTITESRGLTRNAADKERVADEIADVLLYLLQLADHTDVDVEQAVERKLRKNAAKHPAKHPEPLPAAAPPSAPAKVHLLVDWENVQPTGDALRALVPQGTDAWLFHGPKQQVTVAGHVQVYGEDRVTLVPRSGAGRNALDFQLSYYVGYIAARQPDAAFVVVANDQGYDPMLEHARELGFSAWRCEFRKTLPAPMSPSSAFTSDALALPSPAPVPQVRPTSPAVAAPAKPKAKKAAAHLSPGPGKPSASLLEPSAAQVAWRAIMHLRQLPTRSRPDNLVTFMESLISEPVQDKPGLARRAHQLLQGRHLGLARATDATALAKAAPKASLTTTQPGDPLLPSAAVELSAKKKAMAQADAPAPAQKAVATKAVAAAVSKTPTRPTAAQVAQAVLVSLRKMPKNRPTRRAGLLRHIETHASKAADPKAMAQQVCALLEARKEAVPTADGKGITYPKLQAKELPALDG